MAKLTNKEWVADFAQCIVTKLEQGTAPWVKEWKAGQAMGTLPCNAFTKKNYNGINVMHLYMAQLALGTDDNRWATYNAYAKNGYTVRKGEKGTHIVHWKFVTKEVVEDGVKKTVSFPLFQTWVVFNASQVDGMPERVKTIAEDDKAEFQAIEVGEKILSESGASITHDGGDRAYYRPSTDSIHLPVKESFFTNGAYYGTALHELGHWTGHESRLKRDLSGSFGSESYALEELRAEIASWMLSSLTGIPHDPDNHASYIGSWVKSIKEDNSVIVKAVKDAQKIVDYILNLADVHLDTIE